MAGAQAKQRAVGWAQSAGKGEILNAILTHADAKVLIEEHHGRHTIQVEPRDGVYTPFKDWTTDYPLELIEHVFRVKGPDYLCDEIMRDEDELYVQHNLRWDILSYTGRENFAGRRILDFGSGCGASSMVLARMFPETEITGVELVPEFVELARHRAKFYSVEDRVTFHLSPDANSLSPEIGKFDYIMFSAVYEHLLPDERRPLLELLWSHLKPGGVIFLDQTPYRWFPVELHTTGLPLLNYLPDSLTLYCSRRFSERVNPDVSWPVLLRKGIRGGTKREIAAIINRETRKAEFLDPKHLGVTDQIALWYQLSSTSTARKQLTKKLMMWGMRVIKAVTGTTMVPTLSLAIRKLA
jgi:2-polyprenyl-3-methyl-5-hydroxy-6-metoxy-1,4-benzoquinol methylase